MIYGKLLPALDLFEPLDILIIKTAILKNLRLSVYLGLKEILLIRIANLQEILPIFPMANLE